MGRPRKKPQDMTTDEALRKLFPKPVIKKAGEEVRKADEQATKRQSK